MNKRGGILAYYTILSFVFLVWVFGLSKLLSSIGTSIVTNDLGLTGLEAFFFGNLNLFVFCLFLLAFGLGAVLGGGE